MSWQQPSNSRKKLAKDQLQPAILWTDPIHLENRALEEERGRKHVHDSVPIYIWKGMYLCVVGVREDICAQKRKLCSGTRGQTNLSLYDKNQEEIFHSKVLLCTYTGGW